LKPTNLGMVGRLLHCLALLFVSNVSSHLRACRPIRYCSTSFYAFELYMFRKWRSQSSPLRYVRICTWTEFVKLRERTFKRKRNTSVEMGPVKHAMRRSNAGFIVFQSAWSQDTADKRLGIIESDIVDCSKVHAQARGFEV
jgi:hypothetical protein